VRPSRLAGGLLFSRAASQVVDVKRQTGIGRPRFSAASVLQAPGFCGDVTAFRLKAKDVGLSGFESAFLRNAAEGLGLVEAAHNPEVAGSNPAPATAKGAGNGAFRLLGDV
jgi:hypothetical protein